MKAPEPPYRTPLRAALLALALCFAFPPRADAADKCPSGAKRERGRCVCPAGERLAPDGKRCVGGPAPVIGTTKATEPKIKAKGPAASGDHVPAGAKVQILGLSKDDGLYNSRSQYLGKEGVVYPSDLYQNGPAKKGDYYTGTVNIDGVEYFFYQVSVTILGFGALPEKSKAAYGEFVASGSVVKISDISSTDIYYKERKKLSGLTCTVGSEGLVQTGAAWYGGPVDCDNGTSWYFYQFTFDLISEPVAALSACLPGALTAPSISGKRVEILDISSADGYYKDRAAIIGKQGYISDDAAKNGPAGAACWYGGTFTADDGTSYYFWQAQAREVAAAASCQAGASTAASFLDGQAVSILDIGPGDLYYPDRAKLIGKHGKVSGDLHNNGGCAFGGGFTADDGTYYYFAEAQVKPDTTGPVVATPPAAPACLTGAATSAKFKDGEKLTILDIAPDDAYYSSKGTIIGLRGKASGEVFNAGGCWYSGGFTADDGTYYYFAKTQVKMGGEPPIDLKSLKAYTGAVLKAGAWVILLDFAAEDAYYKDRASIVGKRCKVDTGTLGPTSGGYYGGNVLCEDGSSYYLFKAKVALSK